MDDEILTQESWTVNCKPTVFAVRQRARELALQLGLTTKGAEAVAIAVSELANNIVDHARAGEVTLQTVRSRRGLALVAIARDEGPGIADIEWALTDGCSSTKSLGCGLPAVRRLMDEFSIDSAVGRGTVISVRKWQEDPKESAQGRPEGNARS